MRSKVTSNNFSSALLSNIELTDKNENKFNLESHKGKPILVNFWATWCKPCIQEMPLLASIQNELSGEVVFFFVSDEEREKIQAFSLKNSFGIDFYHNNQANKLAGVEVLPTTLLFDSSGELVWSKIGGLNYNKDELVTLIKDKIK